MKDELSQADSKNINNGIETPITLSSNFDYSQSTGNMTRVDWVLGDIGEPHPVTTEVGRGYAGGNEGANPQDVNNPESQNLANRGPLPRGAYTMSECTENNHSAHKKMGKEHIALDPVSSNEMFGRNGFYIHGDSVKKAGQQAASMGCIILGPKARDMLVNAINDGVTCLVVTQ
ncbi:tlde1 domain-containing protein [Mesoterricola silvestris]|uniref:tlde1 domain-containing protein n=1 Tax=Mesoterricola silvestris TaxID=2927979 RepID=UPI00292E84C9|nr:tlde1 domain-containing protein [Mesoterricola silvestris]